MSGSVKQMSDKPEEAMASAMRWLRDSTQGTKPATEEEAMVRALRWLRDNAQSTQPATDFMFQHKALNGEAFTIFYDYHHPVEPTAPIKYPAVRRNVLESAALMARFFVERSK